MICTIGAIILTTVPKVISICTLYPVLLKVGIVDNTITSPMWGLILDNTTMPLQPFKCIGGLCTINTTTISIPYHYFVYFNETLTISLSDVWVFAPLSFTFSYTEAVITSCLLTCFTYTVLANYFLTFTFERNCLVFTKPYSISVTCFSNVSYPITHYFYRVPVRIPNHEEVNLREVDLYSIASIFITVLFLFRMYQFEE